MKNKTEKPEPATPIKLITSTGDINIEATQDLLEFSSEQLAKAINIPESHRSLKECTDKQKESLKELATALEIIVAALNNDILKAKYWLKVPNPKFGGTSPRSLILKGQGQKVLQFVFSAS
ncbi:MAG: antitoxin Xre/MbcA/ParS toxin-binding domain-containing protein [Parvularculaceae bacterium]